MTQPTPPRPDDGTLIRYLDGELPPAEAREVEDAVAALEEVARRLRRFQGLAGETTAALASVAVPDTPPLRARPRRRWRWNVPRVAALVLLGGALLTAAVPALRAGLLEGASHVLAWMTEGGRGEEGPGMTRVAFPVSSTVFTLTLERPTDGSLTLRRGPDDQAEAQVVSGATALRVEPDGLRVLPTTRRTEMEVRLPRFVEEVRLRLPDGEERTVSLTALTDGSLRVPLSSP